MEKLKGIKNKDYIYNTLEEMFPYAKCELEYNNEFELLVAVILSAQTTDKRVNIVTKSLFKKYKNPYELKNAKYEDVYEIVKELGLAKSKATNIINMSKELVSKHDAKVPCDFEELCSLPGVGRKTANVILSEAFKVPSLAVDTHVSRVANRLALVNSESPLVIENTLKEIFEKEKWSRIHHLFIFFGRYKCKAIKPDCDNCPFISFCLYKNE